MFHEIEIDECWYPDYLEPIRFGIPRQWNWYVHGKNVYKTAYQSEFFDPVLVLQPKIEWPEWMPRGTWAAKSYSLDEWFFYTEQPTMLNPGWCGGECEIPYRKIEKLIKRKIEFPDVPWYGSLAQKLY